MTPDLPLVFVAAVAAVAVAVLVDDVGQLGGENVEQNELLVF
jgi:hypothetical protein